MNIFYIDEDPVLAAQAMVDKHIVKMPTESAQMLSTVHRLLDATPTEVSAYFNGKIKKKILYLFEEEAPIFADGKFKIARVADGGVKCYAVAHAHHPSTIWTMQNVENYKWHVALFRAMLDEYTARYGKKHGCEKLWDFLKNPPMNIESGSFTPPTPAMPDKYKVGSVLESYRRFYVGEKWSFSQWKHRIIPPWYPHYMYVVWQEDQDAIANRRKMLTELQKKNSLPMDERLAHFGNALANVQTIS